MQIVYRKFKMKRTEIVYKICKINEKNETFFEKEQGKESCSIVEISKWYNSKPEIFLISFLVKFESTFYFQI